MRKAGLRCCLKDHGYPHHQGAGRLGKLGCSLSFAPCLMNPFSSALLWLTKSLETLIRPISKALPMPETLNPKP